jgi:hypothetical protein
MGQFSYPIESLRDEVFQIRFMWGPWEPNHVCRGQGISLAQDAIEPPFSPALAFSPPPLASHYRRPSLFGI